MNAPRFDLVGQSLVVTGASRGIGFAVARSLAEQGARLRLIADTGIEDAAKRLGEDDRISWREADITRADQMAGALADLDRIDALVAIAGREAPTPLDDGSPEAEALFRRILEVNVVGTHLAVQAALGKMSAGGRIVLTASVWGKSAVPDFAAYIASKHAVIGLMRTYARELGPRGIRVNCACPGWVGTDAALASLAAMSRRQSRPESDILDEVMATQCLAGLQEPHDVAGLFAFLASPASVNITGQAINIDRGEFLG